jgi:hypothetical protein
VTDNNYSKITFRRKSEPEKWEIKETNYSHMKLHKLPAQNIGTDIEDANEWEIIENNFPNVKLKRNKNKKIIHGKIRECRHPKLKLERENKYLSYFQFYPEDILNLHKELGYLRGYSLHERLTNRNLDVPYNKLQKAILKCPEYANKPAKYKNIEKSTYYKADFFNFMIQRDFIGPLTQYNIKCACIMVDTHTGLRIAIATSTPNKNSTIKALWTWMSCFGIPSIVDRIKVPTLWDN